MYAILQKKSKTNGLYDIGYIEKLKYHFIAHMPISKLDGFQAIYSENLNELIPKLFKLEPSLIIKVKGE